jgi:hypothetical protein
VKRSGTLERCYSNGGISDRPNTLTTPEKANTVDHIQYPMADAAEKGSRMKKTAAVIGAAGLCLAAGMAPALGASSVHHFKTVASPSTVKVGQTVTAKGKGAIKGATYYCVLTLENPHVSGGQTLASIPSLKYPKASKSGAISCSQKLVKFVGHNGSKAYNCPPTKAQKKAGWSCAVAFADQKTMGKKSLSVAPFKTK